MPKKANTADAMVALLESQGLTVNAISVDGVEIEPPAAADPPPAAAQPSPRRHARWVKLREHTYICARCGAGKVKEELGKNDWITTYHLPDGTSQVLEHAPPCESGPRTEKALQKYAQEIAAALLQKKGKAE